MSHNIVWTLRDQDALRREFELMFARSPDPQQTADHLCRLFREHVQLFPLEWPRSSQPPSEDTWTFGRVSVRYRRIPDAQTVEVLSVTGPHISAHGHQAI